MTEVHSDAVPARHLRRATGHPALHALDIAELKGLRTTSRLLYVLGVLWGFNGLGIAYAGERMISTQGADVSLGTMLMFYGLASAVVGPYCAWARPGWGHLASMALCLPALTSLSWRTVFNIISLLLLGRAWRLFGDDKVTHEELGAAINAHPR